MIVYSLQTHSGGASSSKANRNYTGKRRDCLVRFNCQIQLGFRECLRRLIWGRNCAATDDQGGKSLHFFELGAELEEDEVNPDFFELLEALGDLLGGAHKTGAEAAVRNGVVFERDALLELSTGEPLLVVQVARRGLLDIGDAPDFVLRFFFCLANDGVTRDAEFE